MKLNKWSFWTICSIAFLCLLTMIFNFCNFKHVNVVVSALQSIALGIALILISFYAWRYVEKKQVVWKVLYFMVVIIALVCVIIPNFL